MEHHYKVLELDKILERLAGETAGGDAAAAARTLRPAVHIDEVRRLLTETDDACRLMAGFGAPSFGQLTNRDDSVKRAASGAALSARELLGVADLLRTVRAVHDWRSHCTGVATSLDDRFAALAPQRRLEEHILATLPNEEEVADNASPALYDIRRKMRAASARVREQLDKMIHSATTQKYLQEPIVTIRDGRFVVPVKIECRSSVPGLVHDTSSSGATVFIEPMAVVETNNELRLLASREAAEIERILAELSAEVGAVAGTIMADYAILVELNLIFAKARLAYAMKGTLPTVTTDGHLLLKGARHPLIDPERVVPIDVELGGAFDTLVITGPNTGGKTVTLKTVGLLTLMTMCGLLPPVRDGSQISVFRKLLVDIGDEQSIEQSLSTFSAHMTNLIRILKHADGQSLVLMDEVGAGTDPIEGAALAVAILEQLRTQGSRVIATTHYAELKAYAIETAGVENGSCEFDVASLRPTYRLLIGTPGRSNAFAIAEKLGMSSALVGHAKELVSSDDRRLEQVVAELEDKRAELERQLAAAKADAAHAERKADTLRENLEKLEAQRMEALEQAKAEGRRLLEKARAEAEALQAELAEIRKQKRRSDAELQAASSQLRSRLRGLDEQLDPVVARQDDGYVLPRPLKVGDTVVLKDIGKEATVTALPAGDQVEVQMGVIRTRTPLSNLKLAPEKKQPQKKTPARSTNSGGLASRMERSANTDLDLRGMNAEEALLEVDLFIDNAVMAGLERLTVIHGKGTGVLRAAVQQHLKRHPSVKGYRLGTFGEGEAGVTIVELK